MITRQYFDEPGNVKYHQIILPQRLLQELLLSLHGTAHRYHGSSEMLQEIRQKYYYTSIAKLACQKWVEAVNNPQMTRECLLLRLPLNYLICRNATSDPKTVFRSIA